MFLKRITKHHIYLVDLRNHCNIFWLIEVSTLKTEEKTACAEFSLDFWLEYLNQPQKYYNDSLSFDFDAFER